MKSKRSAPKAILVTALGFFMACLFIFPIVWFVFSSFKPAGELFTYPLSLFPRQWSFDNYVSVIQNGFLRYVSNSAFISVAATVICVCISSAAGYALAVYRHDVRSANAFFFVFIMGTLIPGDAQIVAKFDVIMRLGLFNSIWGVILPTVASTTGIFLYRQFFTTVPVPLVEAARIDGANELSIFLRIMFPLAKPTTVTLMIFCFVWRWNDYLLPLVVLSDQNKFTIQIAIRNYIGSMNTDWNSILAATVLSMVPLLIAFAFLQKYIVGGISTSGMKG